MRRRVSFVGTLLWFAVLAFLFLGHVAGHVVWADQVPLARAPLASNRVAEVGELLRQGRRLEVEDRWGEALSHYENAIRQYPDEPSLKRRFQFTRARYDLGRRYCDASFRDAVGRLSSESALDLYSEVLVKIQAHFVEAPHWKELVEQGAAGLEIALGEPAFVERNLPRANSAEIDAEIDALRRRLRHALDPLEIRGRDDALHAAALAARLAQEELGLAPAAVIFEFICGATNALDPYSAYLTPDQLSEVYAQIEGNFVGLGIELKMNDAALVIVRVIPGSPAERSGIRPQERIIAVDGRSLGEMSTDQAANLLRGESGTIVELRLASADGRSRRVRLRRERVNVPSVDRVRMLDPGDGIGYLKLSCFQKTTSRDLDKALWKLHREGMRRGLVIDLRGNPGGLLTSAVDAADKFLDHGVIVSTRGRDLREGFTYSAHAAGTWRVPLVVLIDQDSASAAEIFAGAIRDHHRGTVVGRRSYGKGSVQGIFPLSASAAGVRLTTARFYSPNGHPYSLVGVEPDIRVRRTARPLDGALPSVDDDAVLAAAVQAARGRSAQRLILNAPRVSPR